MRLSWMIQVGAKSKDRCPHKRQKSRDTGEAVGREAEGEIPPRLRAAIGPRGWERQQGPCPGASRGQHSPSHSLTSDSGFWNIKRVSSCYSKPPSLWSFVPGAPGHPDTQCSRNPGAVPWDAA